MSFIGSELSDQECDNIALSRFKPNLFEGECELQQTCWFDYRYNHPVKRTYEFAHHYMHNYRELYKRYIDMDAEHIYGLSRPKDPLDNSPPVNKTARLRTPTCLWRARQVADGLSIPYDFYTYNALKKLMETRFYKTMLGTNSDSKTRLNIQASALYSDELIECVSKRWEEYKAARIQWSDNPRLCFDELEMQAQSKPHPYKLAYEKFIVKQIITRTVKEFAIENAISRRCLRPVVANKLFGFTQDLSA